jgi:hypothetical protein
MIIERVPHKTEKDLEIQICKLNVEHFGVYITTPGILKCFELRIFQLLESAKNYAEQLAGYLDVN